MTASDLLCLIEPLSLEQPSGTPQSKIRLKENFQKCHIANLEISMYGDNEELLSKWFKKTGKRDQIFLASKFGYVRGSRTLEIDTSAEYCKKACDMTLEALGTDYIDLCKFCELKRRPSNFE